MNSSIQFVSQTPSLPVNYSNAAYPSLLGAPLIPVINEKQVSAQEKNKQIV
jgi:hypothetical protein